MSDIDHLDDKGGAWSPTGPNQVKADSSGDSAVTATPLEQHVDAFVAVIQAATYPDDPRVRSEAQSYCRIVDIDYFTALSQIILHVTDPATGELVDPDEARWRLADHLGGLVGALRQRGAVVRDGILRNGLPVSSLASSVYDDDDEQEQYA
jgi:hypothetical protein